MTEVVGEADVATFERDGLLVIDPQFPEALLDQVRLDLEPLFPDDPSQPPQRFESAIVHYNRIQDAWRFSEAVRALATAPTVLGALARLYGRRPRPFQTLNFQRGTEQPTHSDTIHFSSEPAGFMCGVWVALEDMDRDNGPLVYYPGSHRRPAVTLRDLGPDVARLMRRLPLPRLDVHAAIYRPHYEPYVQALIGTLGIAPQHALVRRGQAVIWAANLLHGGSPQVDRSRTRWSQVTHCFFEGCRYHTPLLERSGMFGRTVTAWRNPVWIEG